MPACLLACSLAAATATALAWRNRRRDASQPASRAASFHFRAAISLHPASCILHSRLHCAFCTRTCEKNESERARSARCTLHSFARSRVRALAYIASQYALHIALHIPRLDYNLNTVVIVVTALCLLYATRCNCNRRNRTDPDQRARRIQVQSEIQTQGVGRASGPRGRWDEARIDSHPSRFELRASSFGALEESTGNGRTDGRTDDRWDDRWDLSPLLPFLAWLGF